MQTTTGYLLITGDSSRFSESPAKSPAVLLLGAGAGFVPERTLGVCTAGGQEVAGKPVFRMALKNRLNIK